jgi:hypothetical protein
LADGALHGIRETETVTILGTPVEVDLRLSVGAGFKPAPTDAGFYRHAVISKKDTLK